ncbi:MAG TPA: SRPBCC domain-containing protein [Usitatibacter sp.]|jgi:uncharacterized protein YndB with AHSA1/START domain
MYRFATLIVAAAFALPAIAAERMLQKEVTVKSPLPAVWDAWTTTEGIKTFFAPDGHVEARPDGPFQIYLNPYAEPGMKGADDMHVLAVQPFQMLSYTWNAPPSLPEARKQRTVVIIRFASVSKDETRVTLTQVGWGDGGEWDKAYAYFDKAWDVVLGNLQQRFVTGPVDWTEWLDRLKARSASK